MNNYLSQISQRIIVMEGWHATLLALAAGAVSALALAPYHLVFVLFFTFPVLVWLIDGAVAPADARGFLGPIKRIWPAFRVGWLFGFGYFLASFWWVGKAFLVDAEEFIYLLPFAVLLLPAGLALFWGVATALARLGWSDSERRPWARVLALAASLTLFEVLRGTVLTGLPWNNPAYGAMPTALWMQTSGIVGLYGMTFLTVAVTAATGVFLIERSRLIIIPIIAILAHGGYGAWALSNAHQNTVEGVNLRIVQPAIDQSSKWDSDKQNEIFKRYIDLSNSNKGPKAASINAFTHVIWPESAFPFILTQRPDRLAQIANFLPPQTNLITGAMRLEDGPMRKVFNSLYVINGRGEIIEARDKTRLVPFGEFLPFQDILENLGFQQLTRQQGGFAHGNRRTTVQLNDAPPFLPLICYEIIFAGSIRGDGPEPQWIVNVTNDAWFGKTAGPYQHAHQAQVRAVEEGLPVVRAANNGISMVVDGYGRIVESLPLGLKGVVDAKLPMAAPRPLISQYNNTPIQIFTGILLLLLIGRRLVDTNKL